LTLSASLSLRAALPIWEAVGEALGGGHHVGQDAVPLVVEESAGAAVAGLHFVEHQQPLVLIAQGAQGLQVAGIGHEYPAFPLDRDRKSTRLNSSHVKSS